jgi:acetyltransferase-like isoleucine patch superfamily enzyme
MGAFGKVLRLVKRMVLRGDVYARSIGVTVGERCRIGTDGFGSEPFLVTIGDDVTVSRGVLFLTHDGASSLVRDKHGRRYDYRPVTVGSRVFIGANAILLPGVSIGDDCIVGAGSVVTKTVPPGKVVAGNPARVIGTFEEYQQRGLAELPGDRIVNNDPFAGNFRYRVELLTRHIMRKRM